MVLYRIFTQAPANLESDHFSEIRPTPAPAKFSAGFGRCHCSCSIVKTNIADMSGGVLAILISISRPKNTEIIVVLQISSKVANSDVRNEALNCTASL